MINPSASEIIVAIETGLLLNFFIVYASFHTFAEDVPKHTHDHKKGKEKEKEKARRKGIKDVEIHNIHSKEENVCLKMS